MGPVEMTAATARAQGEYAPELLFARDIGLGGLGVIVIAIALRRLKQAVSREEKRQMDVEMELLDLKAVVESLRDEHFAISMRYTACEADRKAMARELTEIKTMLHRPPAKD